MDIKLVFTTCFVLILHLKSIPAESFICPGSGRYPNHESVDCKVYYTCATTSDGNVVASLSKCPGTNIFDWIQRKCVSASSYTCPILVTSTTEASTTEIISTESPNGFNCPSEGRHANPESVDCKTYFTCVRNTNGNLVPSLVKCPGTNIFDEEQKKCVGATSYTCPNAVQSSTEKSSTEAVTTTELTTTTIVSSPIPTTTKQPITSEPKVFTCVTSGRFPNPEQSDCQTYKYCLQTLANTFQEYTFRCPAGSNFNPTESRCAIGYICPKTLTNTTPDSPTAMALTYVCEAEGRFPDPESCNQYIFCTRATDGSFMLNIYRCPPNSWFKPNESRCSASYSCN